MKITALTKYFNRFKKFLVNLPDIKKQISIINKSTLQTSMKRKLYSLAIYGNKYQELIKEVIESDIDIYKKRTQTISSSDPVLICVIKNDLFRLKLMMDYYQSIGVKAFSFLDDHSTDGTREYLLEQPNVTLYTASKPYTSTRRRAWINLIINREGINRWYLIVDSDELFDYQDRETKPIYELTEYLWTNKRKRVKAIMVDMFSPDKLYDENIKTPSDIPRIMNRFNHHYYLEKGGYTNNYKVMTKEGRNIVFSNEKTNVNLSFCSSKYPLMYFDNKDILISSHEVFPRQRNKPDRPNTVLRHYKFLPGDKEKYEIRLREKNFHNESKEYEFYKQNEKNEQEYKACIQNFDTYQSYNSFESIQILNNVWK